MTGNTALYDSGVVRLKECRHGVMAYLANDQHIGRSLDAYGEWAETEIQLLQALLKPGDAVVDAGANIGTHTVGLARKVGPTGWVHSFEPQRFVHQILCTNIALNGLSWVRTSHAALGAAAGSIVVPPIDYTLETNFGGLSLGSFQAGESVPVLALDELSLPRCTLLKMDVEGMELSVLEGARETIERHAPMLYLENNHPEGNPKLVEHLLSLGYSLFWHFSPFFRADNHRRNPENLFGATVDANLLGAPRGRASAFRSLLPVLNSTETAAGALQRQMDSRKAKPVV